MVTNVTSLLKTVKAVEDEHTRGTRALESTIEAIAQEIRVSAIYYSVYYYLAIYCAIYVLLCLVHSLKDQLYYTRVVCVVTCPSRIMSHIRWARGDNFFPHRC
jgi:hypothetical protein